MHNSERLIQIITKIQKYHMQENRYRNNAKYGIIETLECIFIDFRDIHQQFIYFKVLPPFLMVGSMPLHKIN